MKKEKKENEACLVVAEQAAALERGGSLGEAVKFWRKALELANNFKNQSYYANRIEFCLRWKKRIRGNNGH